tara:strand:- start:52 stop:216 length:165 start_codon:yes stop_codon:yes gene_type:complete
LKKILTPTKKYKQKIIDKTFSDQLEDAWHLIEKKRKLKRKQLFVKIDDTNQKNK